MLDITDTIVSIAGVLNNTNIGLISLTRNNRETLCADDVALHYVKDSINSLSERIERINVKEKKS